MEILHVVFFLAVATYSWEVPIFDQDDLLGSVTADDRGVFCVRGFTTEATDIEPYIYIEHNCGYEGLDQKSFFNREVPTEFVSSGNFSKKTYHMGDIELLAKEPFVDYEGFVQKNLCTSYSWVEHHNNCKEFYYIWWRPSNFEVAADSCDYGKDAPVQHYERRTLVHDHHHDYHHHHHHHHYGQQSLREQIMQCIPHYVAYKDYYERVVINREGKVMNSTVLEQQAWNDLVRSMHATSPTHVAHTVNQSSSFSLSESHSESHTHTESHGANSQPSYVVPTYVPSEDDRQEEDRRKEQVRLEEQRIIEEAQRKEEEELRVLDEERRKEEIRLRELEEHRRLEEEVRQREMEENRRLEEIRRAEEASLREGRLRLEEEERKQHEKEEAERRRLEEERRRIEEEHRKAEETRLKKEEEYRKDEDRLFEEQRRREESFRREEERRRNEERRKEEEQRREEERRRIEEHEKQLEQRREEHRRRLEEFRKLEEQRRHELEQLKEERRLWKEKLKEAQEEGKKQLIHVICTQNGVIRTPETRKEYTEGEDPCEGFRKA